MIKFELLPFSLGESNYNLQDDFELFDKVNNAITFIQCFLYFLLLKNDYRETFLVFFLL